MSVCLDSPNGVMCLQEIVGSGLPEAVQMSEILLPSFTVISDDMSYILGGTAERESSIERKTDRERERERERDKKREGEKFRKNGKFG